MVQGVWIHTDSLLNGAHAACVAVGVEAAGPADVSHARMMQFVHGCIGPRRAPQLDLRSLGSSVKL